MRVVSELEKVFRRKHHEVRSVLDIEYKAKQEMITRSKIYRVSLDEVKEAEKPVKSRKEFVNLQAQALLVNSEKLKGMGHDVPHLKKKKSKPAHDLISTLPG
ncbi:hypothetical protein Tco_1114151 [Tanacetum coccineum]|uniref:Uncharacterized protein n=1 Tax=Tanacetum coccineum TaxID=301880 RepID=A0ABQ5IX87_9ASTR